VAPEPGAVRAEPLPAYYRQLRHELLDLLPARPRRVLEVGCAAGLTGAEVKRRHPWCEVIGVELDRDAAAGAATRLDRVLVGDVERLDLGAAGLRDGSLDVILYADVLEHLVDPWALLRRHASLLADGGCVVASLPNVRYCEVLLGLLRGTWEYADAGVLDRGHLRFFTRREGERLVAQAGLALVGTRAIYWQPVEGLDAPAAGPAWVQLEEFRISGLSADTVRDLWAGQIVYAARKGEALEPWTFRGARGFHVLAFPEAGGEAWIDGLEAYLDAFGPDDDVTLVLAVGGRGAPAARVEAAVRDALDRRGLVPGRSPDVVLEPAPATVRERRRWLRAAHVLLATGAVDGALADEAARSGSVPLAPAAARLREAVARVRGTGRRLAVARSAGGSRPEARGA